MPWWSFVLLVLGWLFVVVIGAELLEERSRLTIPVFVTSATVLMLAWMVISYAG